MRLYSCTVLLLGLSPAFAVTAAQEPVVLPASFPPESVAVAFFKHHHSYGWHGSAPYFDPAELGRFADIIQRFLERRDTRKGLAKIFQLSVAEIQALSPQALLEHFLTLASKREPTIFNAARTATFATLGRVEEDSSHVHLVIRTELAFRGMGFAATEVRSFRRTPDGWRLELPYPMQGLMIGMEAALRPEGPPEPHQ
jgi:hypothetical protein